MTDFILTFVVMFGAIVYARLMARFIAHPVIMTLLAILTVLFLGAGEFGVLSYVAAHGYNHER